MSDTLFRSIDLIAPGDLVVYHGSIADAHGLWLAIPCPCLICMALDDAGIPDVRFALIDPWGEISGLIHARRQSITRSAACG
ncbi:hypothetical protein [Streptomyces sp. NPDC002328]|uniref:hypothetical protein n=1 Tax=Streptomyces sp. NPDC002328 TaxID=3364642 RepID=UPI00367D8311